MADPTPFSHAGDDDADDTGRRHASGLARWQKVVGVVGLAVVVALVILLLAGDHGPGRHAPSGRQEQPGDAQGAGHAPAQWNQ